MYANRHGTRTREKWKLLPDLIKVKLTSCNLYDIQCCVFSSSSTRHLVHWNGALNRTTAFTSTFPPFTRKKNQIMKRIIPASDEKNNNGMLSVCVHLRSRAAQHWKLAIKLMLCEVLEPRRAEQFKRWNGEEKKNGKYAHNYLPIVTCNLILWLWLFIMLFLLSFSLTTSARKP